MQTTKTKYSYKGRRVIPCSYKLRSGDWTPRAQIITSNEDTVTFSSVYSKNAVTFGEEAEADTHALQLAATWIDRID